MPYSIDPDREVNKLRITIKLELKQVSIEVVRPKSFVVKLDRDRH